MSVEVVMPQMGESITEGTVSKWLKNVGDPIEKDEAILEISTDKVDAEVPSPGAGTLLEIRHQEGDTVGVGTVLAVISAEGEQPVVADRPQQGASSQEVPIAVSEPEPNSQPAPVSVANELPAVATSATASGSGNSPAG